jgi:hypothetical protein
MDKEWRSKPVSCNGKGLGSLSQQFVLSGSIFSYRPEKSAILPNAESAEDLLNNLGDCVFDPR